MERKKFEGRSPEQVRALLLRQANERLGARCGEKYRSVVVRCLEGDFPVQADSETKSEAKLQGLFREFVVDQLEALYLAVG